MSEEKEKKRDDAPKKKKRDEAPKEKKRDEALVERLMRRVLEGMGSVVDRKLGREADAQSGFTTTKLIERMKHLVDERARTDAEGRRIAPHLFKLKVEWGTHSEAPPEFIKELEHEVRRRRHRPHQRPALQDARAHQGRDERGHLHLRHRRRSRRTASSRRS